MAGWWNPWWYGAYRWLADPAEPALDPGFWNLRSAVDKILAAGSQYAGGYDSHPFELLDTAWLPIVPTQLPNADASSSATPSAPNEPGSSLSGLAFGVLNAALGAGVALTVATAALGGASEAPAESFTRAWYQDEVLDCLELIDEGNQSDSKPLRNFWARYGSIAPAGWKRSWWLFWKYQQVKAPALPFTREAQPLSDREDSPVGRLRVVDLDLIESRRSTDPMYAIQVPDDWDSEKVAVHIVELLTNWNPPSGWAKAFGAYLGSMRNTDGNGHFDTKAYEEWLKQAKLGFSAGPGRMRNCT